MKSITLVAAAIAAIATEQIGKLRFTTPATGNRPVELHLQKATLADLGPKNSKRANRRNKGRKS